MLPLDAQGEPVTIRVLPMCDNYTVRARLLARRERPKDIFGRDVGIGGLEIRLAGNQQVFYASAMHFAQWFTRIDGDQFRSRPHAFALDIRGDVHLHAHPPAKAYRRFFEGDLPTFGMAVGGALVIPERALLVAFFLHDKIHPNELGPMILSRENAYNYHFPEGPLVVLLEDDYSGTVGLDWLMARSRERYAAAPLAELHRTETIFGDAAIAGDMQITLLASDKKPCVIPPGNFARWLEACAPGDEKVFAPKCETHAVRVSLPFFLEKPGGPGKSQVESERGEAGDFIVTEYHPLGVTPPHIVHARDFDVRYELARA